MTDEKKEKRDKEQYRGSHHLISTPSQTEAGASLRVIATIHGLPLGILASLLENLSLPCCLKISRGAVFVFRDIHPGVSACSG